MITVTRSDAAAFSSILFDHCLVRSNENGNYRCAICTTGNNSPDWREHINDPTHVITLERFDIVFERRDAGIHCKACDAHLRWDAFETHAEIHKIIPWHDPQKLSTTFVENQIMKWEDQFYCWPCDVILSDSSEASGHIAGVTHRRLIAPPSPENEIVYNLSYNLLAANGVVLDSGECMRCNVCGYRLIGRKNVRRHIEGITHKSEKLKLIHDLQERRDRRVPRLLAENRQPEESSLKECVPDDRRDDLTGKDNCERDSLDLLCVSTVNLDNRKYYCKICETYSSDEQELGYHLEGTSHAINNEKYGCDNITRKEDNLYYCDCCNFALPNRELAYDHIKEEEHMFNADLPCISIVLVDTNKYRCRICKTVGCGRKGLMQHIEGRQHTAAQKKYGCDGISLKDGNLYYCECCNFTFSNRRRASDHIEEEKHTFNANLPCVSIMITNKGKYHCTICDVFSSDPKDLTSHVKGKQHAVAQKKYGCDSISIKEDYLYYCERCNSTLSSRQHACDHIKEKKHALNVSLPCVSIVIVDIDKYHCTICDLHIFGETTLNGHVNGTRHVAAQKKYGCDSISLKEGNLYYCGCCNSTLSSRQHACDHIKGEEHAFNASLPCISIMIMNEDKYRCTICEVDSCGATDLKNHVKGSQHADAQKKYGCDSILLKEGNLYYCVCCNSKLSSRQLAVDHIKEEKHMSNANITCISIKLVDVDKYNCTICDVDSIGATDLKNHVKGRRHAAAQKKYGCNSISLKEDNIYYCGCCDYKLSSRRLASDHIKEKKHMFNANFSYLSIMMMNKNKYHCTICNFDSFGETDLNNHVKGIQHAAAQKKYGCDSIILKEGNLYYCGRCNSTLSSRQLACDHIREEKHWSNADIEEEKHTFNANLPCVSIMITNKDKYHCTICDVDCSGPTDLKNHVKGKQHAAAQKKYSCDSISHKEGNLYYCACCNTKLSSRQRAVDHIKEEKHMSNANLPCISIRLVDVNQYTCRICNVIANSKEYLTGHMKGKRHVAAQEKYGCDSIVQKQGHSYYCKCCNVTLLNRQLAFDHIKQDKHTSAAAKKSKVKDQQTVTKEIRHEMAVSTRQMAAKKEEHNTSNNAKLRYNVIAPRFKKTIASQQHTSPKSRTRCSVCKASAVDCTSLHVHMAQHFVNDFIKPKKDERSTIINDRTESHRQAPSETESIDESVDRDNESCNKKNTSKRSEPPMKMYEVIKDLEFDANYIYSMNGKSADIELGMKLCLPIDECNIYCLVCLKKIVSTMEDYCEHLRSLEHCEYLDQMENDHQLFDAFPELLSQLGLALQYMEDISDSSVQCHACDRTIDNTNSALQEHIVDENHDKKCIKLNANARERFANVGTSLHCDWYDVQTYWCVLCSKTFKSDVCFAKHLDSKFHSRNLEQYVNAEKKLMLDFCPSCALLWYGYRCTWAYHCELPMHIWLKRERYHTLKEVPKSVEQLLAQPEKYAREVLKHLKKVSAKERTKENALIRDINRAVKTKCPDATAYIFGSRISGLGLPESDIDVFLDCGNMYDGDSVMMYMIPTFMTLVHGCMNEERKSWDVQELLTKCRSPIIRAYHRSTGLSCDISFENGLAVENTLLIKSFNDTCPSCRMMIIILKEWLKLCELSGSDNITNYSLYWYVIFFLQRESILPSVASLIAMKKKSHVVAGWEVGVSREFPCNDPPNGLTIKELLTRFFNFYAYFDYRNDVACPLLGKVVAKRKFAKPESLPREMRPYKIHVKNSGSAFRIDSVMCIQDPFDLQHNLSKAVSKVYLNRFRRYCSTSFDVLSEL